MAYAGQKKVSKDIQKALKKEKNISKEYKSKKEQNNKINYYSKILNKNKNGSR